MILQSYVVGRIQANCYVVGDEDSREALVIDPGDDAARLLEQFEQRDLRVVGVFATHHHLDHSGGVHELLEALPAAEFLMHRLDYPQIAPQAPTGVDVVRARGHAAAGAGPLPRTRRHGSGRAAFVHGPALPGPHSRLALPPRRGDGLHRRRALRELRRRTDFPGGDARTLIESIREHLMTLPDETAVYPGHNQPTTVATSARATRTS